MTVKFELPDVVKVNSFLHIISTVPNPRKGKVIEINGKTIVVELKPYILAGIKPAKGNILVASSQGRN